MKRSKIELCAWSWFLALVLGHTGMQAGAGTEPTQFFRLISPTTSVITALGTDGTLAWSSSAAGITGGIQRATTLTETGWADYVQCVVTGAQMAVRVYDPASPPGMALIPAGINAGTDPFGGEYHLSISEFYMDCAHVTEMLWEKVRMWSATNRYTDLPVRDTGPVNSPVAEVSWHDAVKWCNARSEMGGAPVCYRTSEGIYRSGQTNVVVCDFSVAGYRLPTAVEWEYAARGGLRGKAYPWGDDIDETRSNYDYQVDHVTVAGTYPANGYGLSDMAGNLSGWVWDWHPSSVGTNREIRGGSWLDIASYCRCSRRSFAAPDGGHYGIGFRTAISRRNP